MMNDILATMSIAAQQKNIEIDDKVSNIYARANKSSIIQIVTILLDNAIKYSPEKSIVTISVSKKRHETVISISDNGVGISQKDQTKIFDRFYRVDESRSSMNIRGTGLGLSIAKAICDRQEISISLKSSVDKGSTFSLHIKS